MRPFDLLQARLAQFHFGSEYEKGRDQVRCLLYTSALLAIRLAQRLTAEQARDILEQLFRDQPTRQMRVADSLRRSVSSLCCDGGEGFGPKGSGTCNHASARAKDAVDGPACEENLALIQTIFGENSRAISTLTQLLQTPYCGWFYGATPITPALLRLDPIWDPLRADPAFQKLCEEKEVDKSIAVLPFENLSSDPRQRLFRRRHSGRDSDATG